MEKVHWIGLESYCEENAALFFGRDTEIEELANSIFHNNQTIIYGPSGIGKSSIIKAGVMSLARKNDFLPVYIRLSFNEDSDPSYVRQIITAIREEAKKNDVEIDPIIDYVNPQDISLWEFFHCNRFVNIYDLPIIPLMIIDQFEEIFTLSKDKAETDRFFKNISELCDNITPDYIKTHLSKSGKYVKYPDNTDTRLVISLREDFLPRLEEQASNIPALKRNRFSLQAINGQQAMEIIMKPEPGLVSEDVALSIIRTVSGNQDVTAKSLPDVEVEPSLLSLYCSELDIKRVNNKERVISQKLVEEAGKNIINDFYKEKVSHVSPEAVSFLESRLLTKNGYRDSAPLDDTLADPMGLTQEEYDFLSKNRILRTEERNGIKRIEFTHDILCKAACEYRDNKLAILKQQEERKRQEEERQKLIAQQEQEKQALIKQQEEELARIEAERKTAKKKRQQKTILCVVLAVIISGCAGIFLVNKAKEEKEKSAAYQKRLGKFYINIKLNEDVAVKSLWWEANIIAVGETGEKDITLLDTLVNKMQVDSTFSVPVDSMGYQNMRIHVTYPSLANFQATIIKEPIYYFVKNQNVPIQVKLKDPINYGGQLVMKDGKTKGEYYLKDAIVVLNNEVDFTDSYGRFLFHLQDTVKPEDQMIIIKKDFQTLHENELQRFRLKSAGGEFVKISLPLEDSTNYCNMIAQCDSLAVLLDSLKHNPKSRYWSYYKKQAIKYTANKGKNIDDQIILYIKAYGSNITGYYYYENDHSRNKQYRYHIFNGKIGKNVKDPKDSLVYRTFELTSYDIANNVETVKGKLCPSNDKYEFKIFIHSKQMAESVEK